MKKTFVTLLFMYVATCFGQDKTVPTTVQDSSQTSYNQIFTTVETLALPPGGMNAFRRYVGQSFRLPEVDKTTMGKIITKFTVCDDGSICDIQVISESPANIGLGEEVKRILNKAGNWKPAVDKDKPVSSYFTLPIVFQLTGVDNPPAKEENVTPKKD